MNINEYQTLFLTSSIPGALGGITLFIYSLRKGLYRNNKYKAKLTLELLGGTLVASVIGPFFEGTKHIQFFACFAVGMSWVAIVQIAREKITAIVRALIGEQVG